jgi:hypothetical protein
MNLKALGVACFGVVARSVPQAKRVATTDEAVERRRKGTRHLEKYCSETQPLALPVSVRQGWLHGLILRAKSSISGDTLSKSIL